MWCARHISSDLPRMAGHDPLPNPLKGFYRGSVYRTNTAQTIVKTTQMISPRGSSDHRGLHTIPPEGPLAVLPTSASGDRETHACGAPPMIRSSPRADHHTAVYTPPRIQIIGSAPYTALYPEGEPQDNTGMFSLGVPHPHACARGGAGDLGDLGMIWRGEIIGRSPHYYTRGATICNPRANLQPHWRTKSHSVGYCRTGSSVLNWSYQQGSSSCQSKKGKKR